MNMRKTAAVSTIDVPSPQPASGRSTSPPPITRTAVPTFGGSKPTSPKTKRQLWVRSKPTPAHRQGSVERRYHQTIRRIDLWSVLKVSVCFNLCALVVMLTSGIILWYGADTVGAIGSIEKNLQSALDDKTFKFLPGEILRAATLLGLVFVCLATVMAVLATAFYNLFSDIVGGVEITVSEES